MDNHRINLTNPTRKGEIKFYHPHTKILLGLVTSGNLTELFGGKKIEVPLNHDNYGSGLHKIYHELKSPYALYNWELYFHAVSLIAKTLTNAQRFEEAMNFWHYVFNPIGVKNTKDVWRFLPFTKTRAKDALEKFLDSLRGNKPDKEVNAWRNHPFMPHLIARDRPTAYMKYGVMEYIDNIIAWGDYLFAQDTRETITQATQLYILAGHILGPKPEFIPKPPREAKSYRQLLSHWDAFGNAVSEMALVFPYKKKARVSKKKRAKGRKHHGPVHTLGTSHYFGIPHNPKLMACWEKVEDRLYKIRHCLNIEGVFRKLSLFSPEIDPGLLVRAAAQGLSIGSVLNDLNSAMPNYRFTYLLQKAFELTSEVKALGNALLSAIEKKDNESISLLRARHDTRMQNLTLEIKKQQLEEAQKALDALHTNRKSPEYRLQFYQQITGNEVQVPGVGTPFKQLEDRIEQVKDESGLKLIPFEKEEMDKAKLSADLQIAVGALESLASVFYLIPDFDVDLKPFGVGGGMTSGGSDVANATQAGAKALQIGVSYTSFQSSAAARKSGFLKQLQSNIHQANLAGLELMQLDKQITSQEIRIAMAEKEIRNQQVLIDNAQEAEDFIKNKYTNEQFYQWMIGQLRTNYYQVYTLAYELARKAEKVYRFEKGISQSDYIQFGYFDSANNGLLAGERLYHSLKQLENAYMETRGYDYEITRHISLMQLNPLALIQLKETGICEFEIPEALFDIDYPGQYKRRIKTAALSIPCIIGPYTGLNCMLRLLKHEYRNTPVTGSAYPKNLEESDERFVSGITPINAIAVSQGQNDSGVFELNFRDERYMPFEGAGAISTWRLELPTEFRQFDYDSISDVILHLRYTSSEGGDKLKQEALRELGKFVKKAEELSRTEGLFRMFSLKHEFPNEWYRFLHPASGASQHLSLSNLHDRFPFFAKSRKIAISSVMLFTRGNIPNLSWARMDEVQQPAPGGNVGIPFSPAAGIQQIRQYVVEPGERLEAGKDWALFFPGTIETRITAEELADGWLVVKYGMG